MVKVTVRVRIVHLEAIARGPGAQAKTGGLPRTERLAYTACTS